MSKPKFVDLLIAPGPQNSKSGPESNKCKLKLKFNLSIAHYL
jgi:hypothetical protein